jgi:hypothetical protein
MLWEFSENVNAINGMCKTIRDNCKNCEKTRPAITKIVNRPLVVTKLTKDIILERTVTRSLSIGSGHCTRNHYFKTLTNILQNGRLVKQMPQIM